MDHNNITNDIRASLRDVSLAEDNLTWVPQSIGVNEIHTVTTTRKNIYIVSIKKLKKRQNKYYHYIFIIILLLYWRKVEVVVSLTDSAFFINRVRK